MTDAVNTPAPESGGAEQQLTPRQQEAQARIERLMGDREGPYWKPDHPHHTAAVAEVQALHRVRYAEAEPVEIADHPDIAEARRAVGVQLPEMPAQYIWHEGHERTFLKYVSDEAIPPRTVTALYSWYADRLVLGGGELSDRDLEDFRREFAPHLRPDQIELMVRWYREEVAPDLLRLAGRR